MEFADIVLQSLQIYFIFGLAFALYFVFFGAVRVNPDIKGAKIKFRAVILPGSMILWPYLVYKLFTKKND